MTTKKLMRLQSAMEILLMAVTYFAIMAGIYIGVLGNDNSKLWHCYAIFIPMLIAYFARKKIRNYFLFMACHIFMMFAAIIIGNDDLVSTFYFIAVATVCIHSIRLKMRIADKNLYMSNPTNVAGQTLAEQTQVLSILEASERMSPYYALVMVGFYIYAGYKNEVMLQNVEVALFVMFVILQVMYNQLQNINKVFYTNMDKSEFPAKQMTRINLIIAVIIIVLMLVGMFLFYYGPYGNVFTIAGSIVLAVFKLLLKIILAIWGMGPESSQKTPQEETTTQENTESLELGDSYEGSHIAEALAETVGIMLLIILVGTVIYMIIQYAKRVSASKTEGYDEIEFIKDNNKKEHIKNDLVKKSNKKEDNQNMAYRKLYKKKVIRTNKKPNDTLPPKDLTIQNITKEQEVADKITKSYEKARYSKESVSKEEVDYLKKVVVDKKNN